ncbi:MAG: hypothetical protein O3A25_18345 [Acidobacteria bacterium]|nr:hypothetical protein [Acidobacteriota bacterium]
MVYVLIGVGVVLVVLILVRWWPEPENVFVTFRTDSKIVPPTFAWINSPYPPWEQQGREFAEKRRTHARRTERITLCPLGVGDTS